MGVVLNTFIIEYSGAWYMYSVGVVSIPKLSDIIHVIIMGLLVGVVYYRSLIDVYLCISINKKNVRINEKSTNEQTFEADILNFIK